MERVYGVVYGVCTVCVVCKACGDVVGRWLCVVVGVEWSAWVKTVTYVCGRVRP